MNGEQHIELPQSVRMQLGAVSRRLWVVETLVAVLGAVGGLLAAYLLLFASDRMWDTPAWLRLTLALAGLICGAAFAAVWVNRWLWHRRNARQLATMVQKQYARLGDRLLGIVELAEQSAAAERTSPELCRAAMEQVAGEASQLDFKAAVPTRQPRWFALGVAVLVVVVALGIWRLPPAALNVLWRLLKPVAAIERYTLTRFGDLPAKRIVPYGEPFAVEFQLAKDSRWLPTRAQARFEDQRPVPAEAGQDGVFRLEMPGQTRNGNLLLEAGDAKRAMLVTPVYRPELVEINAAIQWPDYLGYTATTQDVRNGTLAVLEGSELALNGKVNRALKEIRSEGVKPTLDGERFSVAARKVEQAEKWSLEWEDIFGLRAREPFVLNVKSEMDGAPNVDCRGIERVVAILEDESVEFEVVGRDDYGVKEVGLSWTGAGNEDLGVTPAKGTLLVEKGGQQKNEVAGKVRFSPSALKLLPQRVTVQASALDYYPGREPSLSPVYQIFILDRIEHAKLVQQQFEKLQEKLEELARLEESLFDQNRELRKELNEAEAAAKLAEQQRAEEMNQEQLEKLVEEGIKLMREALRNPTIAEQVLKEWAKVLEKMQALTKQGMPQVSKSLGEAQQSEGKPREGKMDEALQAQEKVLKEMLEALKKMSEAQEQMVAGNFVNRLKKAAQTEKTIAGDLTKLVPETIGLAAEQLSPLLKSKVGLMEDRQGRNQKGVRHIRDDLGSFFSRTREKLYGSVHDDMVSKRVVEELEKLTKQIKANVGGQAIDQATQWAGQLEKWAEQLAPPSGGGGGGGGGQGGEMSAEMMELLMKLMRVRLAEEGLRDNTRFLDERKGDEKKYAEAAERLESVQRSLMNVLEPLMQPQMSPKLLQLLGQVQDAMTDSADLLAKPQTDGETIAAQTEVIELLTQSAQQAGGGSGSSMAMAELMMRLMGMGAGQMAGGNFSGGDTDKPNDPNAGDTAGKHGDSRTVDKAGGRDLSRFPAEFREALESYFNAVEETVP